jgi:hypothetical protein
MRGPSPGQEDHGLADNTHLGGGQTDRRRDPDATGDRIVAAAAAQTNRRQPMLKKENSAVKFAIGLFVVCEAIAFLIMAYSKLRR